MRKGWSTRWVGERCYPVGWKLDANVKIGSTGSITERGEPTSIVGGCEEGIVPFLVGQGGQELVAGLSVVGGTDCRSESGEACAVQGLQEARQVVRVFLTIGQRCGESENCGRAEETHGSGRSEGDGERDEKPHIFIAVEWEHDAKDLADVDERSSRGVTNLPTPSQRIPSNFVLLDPFRIVKSVIAWVTRLIYP
jgi:hypothetical protein